MSDETMKYDEMDGSRRGNESGTCTEHTQSFLPYPLVICSSSFDMMLIRVCQKREMIVRTQRRKTNRTY